MPRGLNSTTAKCAEMGAEKISFSSGPFQDSNGSRTDSDGNLQVLIILKTSNEGSTSLEAI